MRTVSRRFALWRADLEGGVCAAPEECVDALADKNPIQLHLDHRVRGIAPLRETFESTLREDVEWQFEGVEWPADVQPGVLVTVTWQAGRDEVVARTTALDEPLAIDGVNYFHEYDPKVVTREFVVDKSNRGRVLHAVRKQGRVFDDGNAVLPSSELAARTGMGRGKRNEFLLRNAVDQLIREGYLTRVEGSVDSTGYPWYPAVEGQKPAEMLFYAPLVEPADPFEGLEGDRHEHLVNGFVRKLPPGAHASERQVTLHQQVEANPLEPGYTYVKKHQRGTNP
ncbi:hypothetical protein ACQPZX_11415 [Actinoplanes sp. CA-142083]|uniref:hypothetical protein n=1 Tax=Actinoplanes sp. CA-142083 TaxID=3239903 RepID=UPI003D926702